MLSGAFAKLQTGDYIKPGFFRRHSRLNYTWKSVSVAPPLDKMLTTINSGHLKNGTYINC